jgi:hypothetical protein
MAIMTQAAPGVLAEAVRRRVGFLVTPRERMERTGRSADPALPLVRAAEDALRGLWVELHYRGRGSGVGDAPRDALRFPTIA